MTAAGPYRTLATIPAMATPVRWTRLDEETHVAESGPFTLRVYKDRYAVDHGGPPASGWSLWIYDARRNVGWLQCQADGRWAWALVALLKSEAVWYLRTHGQPQ